MSCPSFTEYRVVVYAVLAIFQITRSSNKSFGFRKKNTFQLVVIISRFSIKWPAHVLYTFVAKVKRIFCFRVWLLYTSYDKLANCKKDIL